MKKTRKNKARNITKRGRRKKRTGKKWDVKKRSIRTGKKRSIRKKRTGKKRIVRNKRSIRLKQEGGWFDAEDDDEGEVVGQEVAAQKHTQTMKARLNAGIDRDKQERLQIIENNIHPIQFSTDCMVAQNQFKRKEKLTKEANEENDRIEQYLCTKANKHCKFTKQSTKNDCSRFKVPSFLSIFDDSNSDSDETDSTSAESPVAASPADAKREQELAAKEWEQGRTATAAQFADAKRAAEALHTQKLVAKKEKVSEGEDEGGTTPGPFVDEDALNRLKRSVEYKAANAQEAAAQRKSKPMTPVDGGYLF